MSEMQHNATPKKAPRWAKAFLASLAALGNVQAACEAAKIERSTAYRHREADEGFAEAWNAAMESAADLLEEEARRRAYDGVRRLKFDRGKVITIPRQQAQADRPSWRPYVGGPQERAYYSLADVLGYGGEAGGGKSDLALGLSGTRHWRSVIFRREFPRLGGLIDRSREIFNSGGVSAGKDSYNEGLHRWKLSDGRQLQFAAMQYEDDKFNYQGRPHDLYVFDEVTEFAETQVRFVIGWNRSTHIDTTTGKPQRCRVVMTFNPPMTADGEWVVAYFLPWLAWLHPETYQHPNPATPGELRWYATVDGVDTAIDEAQLGWFAQRDGRHWPVESGEPFQHEGDWVVPVRGFENAAGKLSMAKSRTFIPASLADNPILEATGYAATVDAMPEPYRH